MSDYCKDSLQASPVVNIAEGAPPQRPVRQRTLKGGVASYNFGSIRMECVVRDLSAHGAKIRKNPDIPLPDNFHLEIPGDGIAVDCEVRWRQGDVLGVAFAGPVQIKENIKRQYVQPTGENRKKRSVLRKA